METTMQQIIPIFHGESYNFWKIKLITILKARKLWDVVERGITEIPSTENTPAIIKEREDRQVNDMMALQIIQSAVSESIFPKIASASSSREAWNALEMEFQGSAQVRMINLQTLRREYENLKMEAGETINDFTTKLINLSNQLRVHGEEKSDYQVVQKVLISIPERFDSIVGVLEQTKDLSILSVTELIGTLKAHERRLNLREDRINEGAFYGGRLDSRGGNKRTKKRHEKTNKWCGVCKMNNHNEVDCFRRKKQNGMQKSATNERKCYVCNKPGHIAKDCRLRKSERAHLSQEESEEESEDEYHMLFSAVEEKEVSKLGDETWLVDSGCTNHMSRDSRHFINLDRSKRITIRIGNGGKVVSEGKGNIRVSTNKGGDHVIKNVLYVPELARNLLSVSQMISNGYRVIFENENCIIQDQRGRKMLDIKMKDKSFPIQLKRTIEENHIAYEKKEEENTSLWHKRLGHINYDKMEQMQKMKIVEDLPTFAVAREVCESCEMGKQSRKSFPKKSQSKTSQVLELVHSDVCGQMQSESINASKYFLTFIDDYSKMTWVYFMKNKSEVLSKFKMFKSYVENQSEKKIKRLRTDGGGEYLSKEFNKLCQESGIHHEVTTPHSPQQNGIAERKNRTLVEMARSMLKEKNLPNKFWAEAIATSTYLQNRLPSKSLEKGVTPLEIWSGKKPSVDHLRVFGCVCYIHIPSAKRRKLDTKAKQGIFVGYSNESKGYRVYLVNERKIEVSRDVTFCEKKAWSHDKMKDIFILSQVKINSQERRCEDDLNDQTDQESNAFNQLQTPNTNQNSNQGGEDSVGPRGYRSITDLMGQTNEVEEEALIHEMCLMMAEEPQALEEALKDEKWIEAMKEELRMIEKNKTWCVVKRPKDKNVISVKWIFRLKTNASGNAIKHKARLVARGFTQEYGVDYLETFAPVSRYDTIRTIMAIAAQNKLKLYQMDVKSAFLNGELEEEVYIEQPPGFIEEGNEDKVLKLHKALYGLKQAPKAWYNRIDGYFIKNGFERSINDAALYVKKGTKEILVVSLYVDDIIITGSNLEEIKEFKRKMKDEFEMTDLGELSYFLGMEVIQNESGIFLSQENYAKRLLKKFGMQECKALSTPLTPNGKKKEVLEEKFEDITKYRSMIGGLLYLCASRPDIMYASSYLSRYMTDPTMQHYQEAKRVLRYVKGTLTYGIQFKQVEEPELVGFSDSDWGGSVEDKKSTSGYVFTIGSGACCWNSSKQKTVAQSTAEAEYIAICSAANQAIWLQRLVNEIGFKTEKGTRILCDNKSAIAIGKNPVQHRRTKHIDIKYHFVREAEQDGKIKLEHCPGEFQVADILTKPLSTSRFETLRQELGVIMKP